MNQWDARHLRVRSRPHRADNPVREPVRGVRRRTPQVLALEQVRRADEIVQPHGADDHSRLVPVGKIVPEAVFAAHFTVGVRPISADRVNDHAARRELSPGSDKALHFSCREAEQVEIDPGQYL